MKSLVPVIVAVALGLATGWAWSASGKGAGLSEDFSEVSVRNESTRRGSGRVHVGGGLHGGK